MRRQNWKSEEDNALIKISNELNNNWRKVSKEMIGLGFKRSGKSCKERFYNQLNPDINREQWTKEEVDKLFELQDKYGNRWRNISRELPNRTDCRIKNYFYSLVRKVLRRLFKSLQRTKTASQITKTIKPSVISRIFCVQCHEKTEDDIQIEFAQLFKGIILKYKNYNISQTVDPNDIQSIKFIFETLQNLNDSYTEVRENKRKTKIKIKREKIPTEGVLNDKVFLEKMILDNENLIHKIHKRQAIFTSDTYGIEQLYTKFVNNCAGYCAYPAQSLMYSSISSITSQRQENTNFFTPYIMSPEQFVYFQSLPSFYSMNFSAMLNQQSTNIQEIVVKKDESCEVKEEQEQ